MTLSAIILNYNNYADLKKCLLSLRAQILKPGIDLKIIIIDNHSLDGSTARIQKEFPEYLYVFNQENRGFAAGVNQGLKLAYPKSDYFLLINNDASLAPDSLSQLLDAASDLSGPTIFYASDPKIIWQAGGFFQKFKLGVSVPLKNKRLPEGSGQESVDFLSGCVLLIKKNVLEKIGLFDENFFFYGEDLDFCLRAKRANLKISYVAPAAAWHNIGPLTQSRTSPFVLENLAKSYWLIRRRHFPRLSVYGAGLFFFLYTPFRFWQILSGGNNPKNIFAWLKGGLEASRLELKKIPSLKS